MAARAPSREAATPRGTMLTLPHSLPFGRLCVIPARSTESDAQLTQYAKLWHKRRPGLDPFHKLAGENPMKNIAVLALLALMAGAGILVACGGGSSSTPPASSPDNAASAAPAGSAAAPASSK